MTNPNQQSSSDRAGDILSLMARAYFAENKPAAPEPGPDQPCPHCYANVACDCEAAAIEFMPRDNRRS